MRALLLALVLVHSWYDPQCCSDKDCEPLSVAPKLDGDFYVMPNGARFPRSATRPSHDGGWHWCHFESKNTEAKTVYCVYEPLNS